MATLSEMMLVSAVLATSVDLVVVVKGLIAPEIFSADFTEPFLLGFDVEKLRKKLWKG